MVQATDQLNDDAHGTDWLGLTGARVLVVGAGGIGRECALGFARAGARVLVSDLDAQRLVELEPEVAAAGGGTFPSDLTLPGAGAAVVATALDRLGGLDVLVHCVGVNDRRPILDFTEEEWDRILRINLSTAFSVAQAAGRHMVGQGHGRIVMLSSVSGLLAHKNHGPYAASKGGINQLARVMATEWAASGVTVNTLAPGYIDTPLTAEYLARPGIRDGLESLVPAGRLGAPSDVVAAALFLASRHAGFITGHVMYIDGGRTLV